MRKAGESCAWSNCVLLLVLSLIVVLMLQLDKKNCRNANKDTTRLMRCHLHTYTHTRKQSCLLWLSCAGFSIGSTTWCHLLARTSDQITSFACGDMNPAGHVMVLRWCWRINALPPLAPWTFSLTAKLSIISLASLPYEWTKQSSCMHKCTSILAMCAPVSSTLFRRPGKNEVGDISRQIQIHKHESRHTRQHKACTHFSCDRSGLKSSGHQVYSMEVAIYTEVITPLV